MHGDQYANLKIEAFAQLPVLYIMSGDWDVVEQIPIQEADTRVDILKLLHRKGIV